MNTVRWNITEEGMWGDRMNLGSVKDSQTYRKELTTSTQIKFDKKIELMWEVSRGKRKSTQKGVAYAGLQ